MFSEFISVVSILSLLIFGTTQKIDELSDEFEKNSSKIAVLHFFITLLMLSITMSFSRLMLINKEVISLNNFMILEIPFIWRTGLLFAIVFLLYWFMIPIFEFPEKDMSLEIDFCEPMTAHAISVLSFIIWVFSVVIIEFLIKNYTEGTIFYITTGLFNIYVLAGFVVCIFLTADFLEKLA